LASVSTAHTRSRDASIRISRSIQSCGMPPSGSLAACGQ
jgi:hypothetical protein